MEVIKTTAEEKALKQHLDEAQANFEAEIKKHTIKVLNSLGFFFANDADFGAFAANRLTNATVEGVPFHNIVYLDFMDFDNLGTPLFSYRNELKSNFVDGVLTTEIG